MNYLVCETWAGLRSKAVIHIDGRCFPQSFPGYGTPISQWSGYYDTLTEAQAAAVTTGRRVTKCKRCFR
ncbi:MAG: hypothetical protein OXG11_11765 [Chloroflexi bacterium]|nr:hypothetical protein [Chloroflexota bacterium]